MSPITGVESGATISAPTAPTKSGYTFGGWYNDSGLTTAWDFSADTVTANITLYAKWTENTYTVSFNANGGSVSPASAMTGTDGKLTSLPTPTRSGSYSFVGWYTAASGGTQVTLATVFSADATVYAHWTYTGGSSSDSSDSSYDYTPPSNTTTTSDNSTTTNADGSVTEATSRTTTTTNRDGSKTETTRETATTTATDGSTTTSDSTIATTTATTTATETATTKGADGSTTESKSESSTVTTTAADGSTTTTTSATETATTTTEDGSKTTTENKTVSTTTDASGAVSGTGTVSATAVTTAADGTTSTTVTEGVITVSTDEAGTVSTVTDATATTTDSEGNVTVTETVATEAVAKDGSTGETVVDKATEELISADIVISQQALDTAIETEEPIQAPVTIPVSTAAANDASPISVKMPAFESGRLPVPKLPTVELQVTRGGFGAVAVQKLVGGLLRVIKECRMGSVIVPVEGDCELVIVDNSRDFLDVSENAWYKDSVDFVVSRSIFGGVSPRMFDPDAAMTRGMVAQVLYNFDRNAEALLAM